MFLCYTYESCKDEGLYMYLFKRYNRMHGGQLFSYVDVVSRFLFIIRLDRNCLTRNSLLFDVSVLPSVNLIQ